MPRGRKHDMAERCLASITLNPAPAQISKHLILTSTHLLPDLTLAAGPRFSFFNMHFQYSLLALAGLAAAAPTAQPSNTNEEASFLSNVQLEVDDVVLVGVDGRFEVVKETEFVELTKAANITIGADKADESLSLDEALEIGKRQNCPGLNSEFVINRREEFLDWDVQISPVIGTQQGTAIATIARGYQVANGISVSAEVGLKGEVFSAALGIELSRTWTTIDTTTISYNVPMGGTSTPPFPLPPPRVEDSDETSG
jgi:hypothetical protein